MIQFGVCQWSLSRPGPAALAQAAGLGFSVIHLDAGQVTGEWLLADPALRAAYGRAAAETGVALGAIAPGYLNDYGLTSPPGSEAAQRSDRIIQIALEAAADLRVPLVFLPSFRASEIRTPAELKRTAEVLRPACRQAAVLGLTVATENTLGAEGNRQLLEAVGEPNLRVLLDTQNAALWGHDPAALVEALGAALADQPHVKDGRGGQMGNAVLGEGEGRFEAAARALQTRGFAGALISENDYLGPNQANAARDLVALARLFPG